LNWQRVLSNRVAVVRAQETYEANIREFQLGLITGTELLLTLDQLAEARSALVFSVSDFQNALVDLAFATGTMLGKGGVLWTPAAKGP
jgi:outer membrane protein TolC